MESRQTPASTWRLQLLGRFHLISSEGRDVTPTNRKVQALLAILALHTDQGVAREELGRILWPEMPADKRDNNLRQTLARARAVVGPENIDSNRSLCCISSHFRIEVDVCNGQDAPEKGFMPGFEGEWFEKFRRGSRQHSTLLISSFCQMLDWLAVHDPARMLGLMRENLGMTIGLGLDDRRRILTSVKEDLALPGWLTFFRAGLLDEGYTSAEAQFHEVLRTAESKGDLVLGVQASAQLCICAMLQSKFHEAQAYANLCSALASKSNDKAVIPTSIQVQGMALLHRGRQAEGFALLERAEQEYKQYLDSVIIRCLRGYYLATYGHYTEADQCMEIPRKVRDETGHGLIRLICGLADAQIVSHSQDVKEALHHHQKVMEWSEAFHDRRFTVVSTEEVAMTYLKLGEVPLAKQSAVAAKRLRKSMAMTYTPWDQMRLALSHPK